MPEHSDGEPLRRVFERLERAVVGPRRLDQALADGPKPWWWCDFTGARSPSSGRGGCRPHVDLVVGEDRRRLLVFLVADDLGQVLHEVAAAGDVQHLRARGRREHRHVALERGVSSASSPRSRSGRVPIVSGCASWPYSAGSMSAPPEKRIPSSASSVSSIPSSLGGTSSGRPPAASTGGRRRAGPARPARPRRPSERSALRTS